MERHIDYPNPTRTLELGAGSQIYHRAKTDPIGGLKVCDCESMQRS
jgi:hypothetical protein